jgi:hypothetical protein
VTDRVEYKKLYYKANKERYAERSRIWRQLDKNKEIISENSKKYYKENKERILAYSRAQNKANKEYIAEWRKIYIKNNKELIAEQKKAHYAANKLKYCERSKMWREMNKELMSERRKEYYKKNPEKRKALAQRRRARELGVISRFTSADWKLLVARSRYCHWCKKEWAVNRRPTHDHVIPISKGRRKYARKQRGCLQEL